MGWLGQLAALKIWVLGLVLLVMAGAPHASPWPITQVEVIPGDKGPSTIYHQDDGWQAITLPDAWLVSSRSDTWTYRFALNVCSAGSTTNCLSMSELEAFWIPKVGRELTVWVNGVRVRYLGPEGGAERDITRRPVLVFISSPLLHPGRNEFRLVVKSPAHQVAGLSRVWMGAEVDLMKRHTTLDFQVMGMSTVVASGSLIAAALSLLIALRFGGCSVWLFFLVSVLWATREFLMLLGFYFLTLDTILALAPLLQGMSMLLSCWLLLELMALPNRRWVLLLQWLLACVPLVAFGSGWGGASSWAWIWGWHELTGGIACCMTAVVVYAAWRQPSWSRSTVAIGMVGAATLGFMDDWRLYLSGKHEGFEHVPLTSLMSVTFLLSVSSSVYLRVSRAMRVEQQHKQMLEEAVRKQRQELQHLHARESERLRAETITVERARIVREMHDGLGAQLVGLLSTVDSGEYTQAELSSEVHEAMSHLRVTIDTLDPLGDDLASLLGQLRFRLEGRLRKAGLTLRWQVRPLPVVARLGAAELGHLQRLLFEAFTNVIKHASATQVEVCASQDDARQCIDILIRDNGRGFSMNDAPQGRGVNNMRYRAEQIGADLRITAAPSEGTEIHLTIPLTHHRE